MKKEERAKKEEQIKTLLADSIIDDILKEILFENVGKFTEKELNGFLKSLEAEQRELKKGVERLDAVGKAGDAAWNDLEKAQAVEANKAVDDAIDDVVMKAASKSA